MTALRNTLPTMAALLLIGCYHYAPVDSATIRAGEQVRVTAERGTTLEVRAAAGLLQGEWISAEGWYAGSGGDTVVLTRATLRSDRHFWEPQSALHVVRRDGQTVGRRQLDPARTFLAFALPASFVAVLLHGVNSISYGGIVLSATPDR